MFVVIMSWVHVYGDHELGTCLWHGNVHFHERGWGRMLGECTRAILPPHMSSVLVCHCIHGNVNAYFYN